MKFIQVCYYIDRNHLQDALLVGEMTLNVDDISRITNRKGTAYLWLKSLKARDEADIQTYFELTDDYEAFVERLRKLITGPHHISELPQ